MTYTAQAAAHDSDQHQLLVYFHTLSTPLCDVSRTPLCFTIVARVRVRETGAAAPGARTAAPRIWACNAWVRQVVETCSRDNVNT